MFRNRSFGTHAIAAALTSAALAALAWHLAGAAAAGIVTIAAVCVGAIFAHEANTRYKQIARLAEQVDRALAGDRSISFADMSEGELAILSSEIDKVLSSLSITNEELAQEKESLADSLADISHQLRTPLTSLGLELELMRKETSSAESRSRVISIERQLERVQWLVSSLLKLARLDSGTVELTRQHVEVEGLIRDAFQPLAISFDLADVALETNVTSGAGFEGDPAWTREALTNILKNCLEHTPQGGHVSVQATEDALACRIRIQDTGPGFCPADIPHVFDRFWRGTTSPDETDPANPKGVGIGLSLAKALITAQDGQIVASNATNAKGEVLGARFDIALFKVVV